MTLRFLQIRRMTQCLSDDSLVRSEKITDALTMLLVEIEMERRPAKLAYVRSILDYRPGPRNSGPDVLDRLLRYRPRHRL